MAQRSLQTKVKKDKPPRTQKLNGTFINSVYFKYLKYGLRGFYGEVMKKILTFLIILLMAYALVVRFVEVRNTESVQAAPPYPCITGTDQKSVPQENLYPCSTLNHINELYQQEVKPIFGGKCMMCHGVPKSVPLYAKIPPSSWLVEKNQRGARKHLDMRYGFPFRNKKGIDDALEDIKEVVDENEMPPMDYKIMHWQSSLTNAEKQTILKWVGKSRAALRGQDPVVK